MYQSDYILRIIEQLGVMLRAMLDALREHRPEEALKTSDEALRLATGLSPALADSLTAESLVSLLSAGGDPDTKRLLLLAEVLLRRAQALEGLLDYDSAVVERRKAYHLLSVVREGGSAEDIEAADALLHEVGE